MMMTPRVLAEVRGRDDLHHALRFRAEEVNISRSTQSPAYRRAMRPRFSRQNR
jgi:hypothetical protein